MRNVTVSIFTLHIAKNINGNELENTVNWYLSNENLLAANSHLVDFIGQIELPNLYRRHQNKLHTSSDGQKYEVSVPSLNANSSFKYFGQNRGVSVYSFMDERHLLFYSNVISSSERETANVIDGLLHNDAVKSDIHSTVVFVKQGNWELKKVDCCQTTS